jgi:hypothetical protein
MKRPDGIESLTLAEETVGAGGAYPPLGFKPVWEADLGNGDYYGLYWPYGREKREPVVCDMFHDGWGLHVAFSTVPLFLQYLELNDGLRGDIEVDDPNLPSARFLSVRTILHDRPEEAISRLTSICADFPECADYWFALAGQLRRLEDKEGSARAAIRAFASNWAFGMPPNGTLKLLQQASATMPNDPLIARSAELSMAFGGTKENPVYDVLKDCIAGYLTSDDPLPGILLNQNYGYMMLMETTAFQERYGFKLDHWLQEHAQLCATYLGDDRRTIS